MKNYDTIAVIGPTGNKDNVLLGDIENSSFVDAAYEVSILEGITNKVEDAADVTFHEGCLIQDNVLLDPFYMSDALKAASEADIVIFTGGIHYELEGEAQDREGWTIALPGKQVELMNKIKEETGKPIVVVLVGSCALQVSDFIDSADAIVMAGYPGMEGGNAVADVLFGDYNPSGKLTVTTPVNDGQMPYLGIPGESEFDFSNDISTGVGYRYYDKAGITPQFAFGYGLSYTTFDISDMKINGMAEFPFIVSEFSLPVTVSVDVTNTGTLEGSEVIQLYISYDENSTVSVPVKQLKGFAKVNLAPGETQTVEIELGQDEFSHYEMSSSQFVIETGLFHVLMGNSSDNLLLQGSVYLSE
jgi:beta-glucosidase